MAQHACSNCGSLHTQYGFDEITCLDCGHLTKVKSAHNADSVPVSLDEQYSPCDL